jgi:hypothetical protein
VAPGRGDQDFRRARSARVAQKAPVLGRLEVEVVEDRACLAGGEGLVVALDEQVSVAEDAVGEWRRRLVEQHEIDGTPGGGFEARDEAAERVRVPGRARSQLDRHVGIAVPMARPTRARAEQQGVGDGRLGVEGATQRVFHHAVSLARPRSAE